MDSIFPLNGLTYNPLRDFSVSTGAPSSSNISNIVSWSSYGSASGLLPTVDTDRQQQKQLQDAGLAVRQTPTAVENAFIHLPTSVASSSSPYPTSCHPLEYPLDITATTITTTNPSTMDLLQSFYSTAGFNQTNNSLSSYYGLFQHADMSRSSSTSSLTCVDPAALILSSSSSSSSISSSQSTSAGSPCLSSPGSRRHSSFSIQGSSNGVESEDDQQTRLLFAQNLLVSSPPLLMPTVLLHSQSGDLSPPLSANSTTTPSEYAVAAAAVATPSLLHDFIMPDGAVYRFDGTSLVPAPSVHFSNVASQSQSSHLDESPVLNSMSMFTSNNMLLDDGFSPLLMPSYLQMLPAYSMFDNSASPMLSTVPIEEKFSHACTITARTPTGRAAKKRVLKNNNGTAVRRPSSDSVSSSASSSVDQRSCSTGSGYSSSNSSKSHKYRKDGVGEYQCPFNGCSYRYNLRRELNRHKNVHLFAGKDRYRCVNCNSGLCRLDSVKRHMEAKGKTECLKRGLYKEFRDNGELLRVRKCKPRWYETAAANAAANSPSVPLKA